MSPSLMIIGSGLSGLFAGCLALKKGWQVSIAAFGVGGLTLGHGCIDVHGYHNGVPLGAPDLQELPPAHPYHTLPRPHLQAALDAFSSICAENGYPVHGTLASNWWLPTPLGATRASCLVPTSMVVGDLRTASPIGLAGIAGWRDFYPQLAQAHLPVPSHAFFLQLPAEIRRRRDLYPTDLAHILENSHLREQILRQWERDVQNEREQHGLELGRIGLPAILGLDQHGAVFHAVEDALHAHIFEIPTLPPSVPGLRLYQLLKNSFQRNGGQYILGSKVVGQIGRHGLAIAELWLNNGRKQPLPANAFLLASGGFAHGGLVAEQDGTLRESVFNVPLAVGIAQSEWAGERYLGAHRYAQAGLQINADGRVLDAYGGVVASNLWACGSILAGADRMGEGSREGISLWSAYAAVEGLTPG
ncbi:MAG TPA: anaerobic glycerol-3-phosphate dehydrogenase subunit GlpB [Anaerolineales bacterium]|nr:anaerobic glycerol-3-phosphate dehydrogenase subunit GlpB [Anaerolineales bacterium]